MKNLFALAKFSFAATAVAGISALSAVPAQAVGLSFSPGGDFFPDGDPIKDIIYATNSEISFDIILDTFNLSVNDVIQSVTFEFGYDGLEFVNPTTVLTPGLSVNTATLAEHALSITYSGLNIPGHAGSAILGSLLFKTTANLPNDGTRDFFTTLTGISGTALGNPLDLLQAELASGNIVQTYKQVEVQAVPTPALLPGLVGMGAALVRKRRENAEQAA